ncbi:MAG: hypothetical protein NZM07_03110, partial [Elioraea sp.]|nr:hypothetical protein [Elioraea sp.]
MPCDAGGSLLLRNYRDGDFGIRLYRLPEDPYAAHPIRGDLEPVDFDPPNRDYRTDSLGNLITDAATPAAGRADLLYDSEGSDWIEAGGGDDVVTAIRGGGDRIAGGAGRDILIGGAGEDLIEGGSGDDIAQGGAGDDRLYGRDRVELDAAIAAGESAPGFSGRGDLLSGEAGEDLLVGSAFGDLLFGGAGRDLIVGGGGADNLVGDDSLLGATLDWVALRSESTDASGLRIYALTYADALAAAPGLAEGDADVLYGGAGEDWVFAGAGDDYLEGGAGDDVLFGEAGADIVIGGSGDDHLVGDSASVDAAGLSGDDYLEGGEGEDTLLGGGGDDVLVGGEGTDILVGGAGADLLWGGPGDDVIVRGEGTDIVFYERGDGRDTVLGVGGAAGARLVLGQGFAEADVVFRLGSLVLDFGAGDEIRFEGFDASDPLATPMLEAISFADGQVMSFADILARGFVQDGSDEDEVLFGTPFRDRIEAKGGADTVLGRAGDDAIAAGAGDDYAEGNEGDDAMYGDAGSDELLGGPGQDALFGGEAEDALSGGEGDDVLAGGAGADHLAGGAGSDTYLFAPGDGADILEEQGWLAVGVADPGTDTIRFDAA